MNKPPNPPGKDKTTHLDWTSHIGVIISFSGAAIIVVKLLCVAGWDQNTAFAILTKSGTGNVLTGALLASMPTLITLAVILYTPRIEEFIASKNPAERGALRLLQLSIMTVAIHIVSAAYFISIIGAVVTYHLSKVIHKRRINRKIDRQNAQNDNAIDQSVTRLEATTVFMAIVICTLLGSLSTPWMPTEIYNTPNGKSSGYILSKNDDEAYVLNQHNRDVVKVSSSDLTGTLCSQRKSLSTTSITTYFKPLRYDACPGRQS